MATSVPIVQKDRQSARESVKEEKGHAAKRERATTQRVYLHTSANVIA